MRSKELVWDPSDPDAVEQARIVFAGRRSQGLVAYRPVEGGGARRMVEVRRFEAGWGRLLFVPALAGG